MEASSRLSPNDGAPPAAATAFALTMLRGIAGAIVGGLIGYLVFRWLSRQGFYAHALPGALLGLGAGLAARQRSQALAILCAIFAAALIIVAEWLRAPFRTDPALSYFLTHLHQIDHAPVKFLMMGVGTACAYWFGHGR